MKSDAKTVEEYLASLPPERREALATIRRAIRARLPAGYEEAMNWGMITWQVPLALSGDTYNGQPLMLAALASQKHHMALYLTGVYMDEGLRRRFEEGYRTSGKRPDMGRSCLRFRRLEDLALDVVVDSIAALGVEEFVGRVRQAQSVRAVRRPR